MKIELDGQGIEGAWAKVGEHIKDGSKIKIMDAGQVIQGKFGEQYVFKIMTQKKEELNISFNRTSRNQLGRGYGTETEDWVGKLAICFVVKQMVGDKLLNVLYVAPDGWTMNEDGEFGPKPSEEVKDVIDDSEIPF